MVRQYGGGGGHPSVCKRLDIGGLRLFLQARYENEERSKKEAQEATDAQMAREWDDAEQSRARLGGSTDADHQQ